MQSKIWRFPRERVVGLTRFRRTSDGEVIPGPEHGFDIVGGYFSADLKSSLSLIH